MTITIDLPDSVFEHLQLLARDRGITIEVMAQQILTEWLNRRLTFEKAARDTLEQNDELYRRLARHEAAERRQ